MRIIFFADKGKTPTVYMDDMALYYKPTASDTYDVSVDFPTVTVTAENGFDANAVEAITAEPAKYISGSVESVAFTGTTMTITLKSADEFTIPSIVNAAGTATYPETKVSVPDYNTLLYGLKNYYWSASSKSVEGTNVAGNTAISGYEFKNDETVGDYLEIKYNNDAHKGGVKFNRDLQKPYDKDEPYTYTYLTKLYLGTNGTTGTSITSSLVTYNWSASRLKKTVQPRQWVDYVIKDYVIDDLAIGTAKVVSPNVPYIYFSEKHNMLCVAYIGLYYKPTEKATAPAVRAGENNTAVVTYAEGIDAAQAAALEEYFTEYFGGDVTALTVDGNDVTLTLKSGVYSVDMPELANETGDKVYDSVKAVAAVYPTSDESLTTIRGKSPAGLRFQSHFAVDYIADPNLTEFGYVVARKEVLGDAELTAKEDSVKKIVSPSYKRDGSVNKFEKGIDNITFAAVLVNIPNTKYRDKFAVRPYVVYGGQYFYGDTMVKSIYEIADSLKADATGDVAKVIEKILNGQELDKYPAE